MKLNEIYGMTPQQEADDKFLISFNIWPTGDAVDGKYDVDSRVFMDLQNHGMLFKKLPVKFGKVDGHFTIQYNADLNSLEGLPTECKSLKISHCKNLTSLEHCTPIINGGLDLDHCNIRSLVGISDHIKKIDGYIDVTHNSIMEGGIGLLLIEGLGEIYCGHSFNAAATIIYPYLGKPDMIFQCQAELIEAGLEAFALL